MATYEAVNAQGLHVAEALVTAGLFRKVERVAAASPLLGAPYGNNPVPVGDPYKAFLSPYLGNGMPIETNFETIAKTNLGVCEDKKEFKKALSEAVKEYGHDDLIEGFCNWTEAQSGVYMRRKPVTDFLKNASQNISTGKPVVSNPLLDKLDKGIALLTDNKVFFLGGYRVKLAGLLREYGLNPVSQAFAEFSDTLEEKRKPYAAYEFLQTAPVIIHTIHVKQQQKQNQLENVAAAYEGAKEDIQPVEQEEEL